MDDQPVEKDQVMRLLDANANRAAEGLRTLDEIARLVCEDAWSAAQIKNLRHELAIVVAQIPRRDRLSARSTETDAGAKLTSEGEGQRASWRSIIEAAAERVGQSLRCLEEFSKFLSADIASGFKSLRYRTYDILAGVELRLKSPTCLKHARLYVLVDCQRPIEQFVRYLSDLVADGADVIQIRDKELVDSLLLQYVQAAVQGLVGTRAFIIVNDRPDIALCSGAAGVHVGQEDLPIGMVRRLVGYGLLVGVSTHSLEQALEAERQGADYIGVGPTFPTTTKRFESFPGLELVRQVSQRITIPAFAIGGISHENLSQVLHAGAYGVALSSAIHSAAEPRSATLEIAGRIRKILAERDAARDATNAAERVNVQPQES